MGFLTDVVGQVKRRLERQPLDDSRLMSVAMALPPTRPFAGALWSSRPPAVIAEVKRASPSAGWIGDVDAANRAREYEKAGASAVSVLTEANHFDGALADLRAAHLAVSIPVLRKDFLVHPSQLIESRVEGADAVLLIAAALSEPELKAMLTTCDDLGLDALVETHSEHDLDKALRTDAKVVGVNARDLDSLEVDLERALSVLRAVPDDRIAVLESGVSERAHVERAVGAGARAVLIGETLMRADDVGATLRALRGEP
jgi:indole-3-glycerol phosphate synthase